MIEGLAALFAGLLFGARSKGGSTEYAWGKFFATHGTRWPEKELVLFDKLQEEGELPPGVILKGSRWRWCYDCSTAGCEQCEGQGRKEIPPEERSLFPYQMVDPVLEWVLPDDVEKITRWAFDGDVRFSRTNHPGFPKRTYKIFAVTDPVLTSKEESAVQILTKAPSPGDEDYEDDIADLEQTTLRFMRSENPWRDPYTVTMKHNSMSAIPQALLEGYVLAISQSDPNSPLVVSAPSSVDPSETNRIVRKEIWSWKS